MEQLLQSYHPQQLYICYEKTDWEKNILVKSSRYSQLSKTVLNNAFSFEFY